MTSLFKRSIAPLCVTGLLVNLSFAAITAEQAAELGGPTLTPVGAERAGNKAGTIPAADRRFIGGNPPFQVQVPADVSGR